MAKVTCTYMCNAFHYTRADVKYMHVRYTASVAECTQLRLDMSSPCGVQGYGRAIWTGDSVPAGVVATRRDLGFSGSVDNLAFFTGTTSL